MNVNFNSPKNEYIPHPEKVFLGSGELRLACSKKKTVITVVITAFIFLFFTANALRFLRMYIFDGRENADSLVFICIGAIFFICGLLINILRSGEKYRWDATGREFTVSRKNRRSTIIFYKEVILVEYEDLKLLNFLPQGYLVTVRTVRDTYEFKYVFPGVGKRINFEDTPFGKLSRIVDDLRAHGLDEALREKDIPSFENPSIEDAFRNIIAGEKAREIEKENNSFRYPH